MGEDLKNIKSFTPEQSVPLTSEIMATPLIVILKNKIPNQTLSPHVRRIVGLGESVTSGIRNQMQTRVDAEFFVSSKRKSKARISDMQNHRMAGKE